MKAVILAGGRGSRLSDETLSRPKPLVEVGDKPILWHIINTMRCMVLMTLLFALATRATSSKNIFITMHYTIVI